MLYALSLYSTTCQLYRNKPRKKNHSGMCVKRTNLDSNFRISLKKIFKEKVVMREQCVNATTIPEERLFSIPKNLMVYCIQGRIASYSFNSQSQIMHLSFFFFLTNIYLEPIMCQVILHTTTPSFIEI